MSVPTNFHVNGCNSFWKIHCFYFILLKSLSYQNMSLQGHHLNQIWRAGVPDATYQVSWKSACWFWRRRFLKGFYHIWACQPSWSCDPDATNKIPPPPTQGGSSLNLALIGQAASEKMFEHWERRTDDERTDDEGRCTIGILKAHLWAFGSGELKMGEIWGWYQIDKKWYFSLFLHKIICCGCVIESSRWGDSNTHPQHMIFIESWW